MEKTSHSEEAARRRRMTSKTANLQFQRGWKCSKGAFRKKAGRKKRKKHNLPFYCRIWGRK